MAERHASFTTYLTLPITSEDLLNYLQLHEKESMDSPLPYAYLVHKSQIVFEPIGTNSIIFVKVTPHKKNSCQLTLEETTSKKGNLASFFIETVLACVVTVLCFFYPYSIIVAIGLWAHVLYTLWKHNPFLPVTTEGNTDKVVEYLKKIARSI